MKYLKELLKEKKYVPVIIAVLVVTEAFLFTFYGYHWLKTVRYLILSAFLVVLGFIDSKRTLIPNQLLIMMLVARAMLLIGEIGAEPAWWKECLKSAFGGLGLGLVIFLAAWFLSRKSIGMGDVKLAAVIGWYLGGSLIWFDLVVCLSLSAIFSIVQLLRKKLTMKDSIPLAPFFSVGTSLILIIGF